MENINVSNINAKFDQRLKRMDKFNQKRPVNSFAVVAPSSNAALKPEISSASKVGATYKIDSVDYIVDTRVDETIHLDTYTVKSHPKAGHVKFTPKRLTVEHTREK